MIGHCCCCLGTPLHIACTRPTSRHTISKACHLILAPPNLETSSWVSLHLPQCKSPPLLPQSLVSSCKSLRPTNNSVNGSATGNLTSPKGYDHVTHPLDLETTVDSTGYGRSESCGQFAHLLGFKTNNWIVLVDEGLEESTRSESVFIFLNSIRNKKDCSKKQILSNPTTNSLLKITTENPT
jgi:hypothetical protein